MAAIARNSSRRCFSTTQSPFLRSTRHLKNAKCRPTPWTFAVPNHQISYHSFSTAAVMEDEDESSSSRAPSTPGYTIQRRRGIRNVAIVAHVDHGKTTLVDELLKTARASAEATSSSSELVEEERLMDSGELEKERGITITSKVTRLDYLDDDSNHTVINVVDTPGHADFAAEVDRILSTVDGVVLLVDITEGPKSQTKYVLSRALSLGLIPIVVLNKVDRAESLNKLEGGETELDLMELFEVLGATESQMEYRTLFGSGRSGWVTDDVDKAIQVAKLGSNTEVDGVQSMKGLLDAILEDIPCPSVHWYGCNNDSQEENKGEDHFVNEPFSMTATTVGYDNFLGRTCTGRIYSGHIQIGDNITLLRQPSGNGEEDTNQGPTAQITGIFANKGVSRVPLDPSIAYAGDIVTLTGVPESLKVGDTLTSTSNKVPMAVETPPLAPPTLSCLFGANNGPLVSTYNVFFLKHHYLQLYFIIIFFRLGKKEL